MYYSSRQGYTNVKPISERKKCFNRGDIVRALDGTEFEVKLVFGGGGLYGGEVDNEIKTFKHEDLKLIKRYKMANQQEKLQNELEKILL
jgi:hypothetical protein